MSTYIYIYTTCGEATRQHRDALPSVLSQPAGTSAPARLASAAKTSSADTPRSPVYGYTYVFVRIDA